MSRVGDARPGEKPASTAHSARNARGWASSPGKGPSDRSRNGSRFTRARQGRAAANILDVASIGQGCRGPRCHALFTEQRGSATSRWRKYSRPSTPYNGHRPSRKDRKRPRQLGGVIAQLQEVMIALAPIPRYAGVADLRRRGSCNRDKFGSPLVVG